MIMNTVKNNSKSTTIFSMRTHTAEWNKGSNSQY